MKSSLAWPIAGVLAAMAVTTAMDLAGFASFSALALLPLVLVLWYLERHSLASMGLASGRLVHYGLALSYPAVVLGAVALIATMAGAADLPQTDWPRAWRNFALLAVPTAIGAILTEEGFFRGWLWASLTRARLGPRRALLWSSISFSLWHISAVAIAPDFRLPPAQMPVYILCTGVIGVVWGLMRWMSGSVIVTGLSHGVWSGGAYVFFGFGNQTGALGIANTALFGPEVGVVGLAVNAAFAAALWWWWQTRATVGGPRETPAASRPSPGESVD